MMVISFQTVYIRDDGGALSIVAPHMCGPVLLDWIIALLVIQIDIMITIEESIECKVLTCLSTTRWAHYPANKCLRLTVYP